MAGVGWEGNDDDGCRSRREPTSGSYEVGKSVVAMLFISTL